MAVNVRYNSRYFSFRPLQKKSASEMSKFYVVRGECEPRRLIFLFYFKCFSLPQIQFRDTEKQRKMTLGYREIRCKRLTPY